MKYSHFSNPIKKSLQMILLLAMLFFNFGISGVSTVYAVSEPPVNDQFANAASITSLPYNLAGTALDTTGASREGTNEPNPGDFPGDCEGQNLRSGRNTVWYSYSPGVTTTPVYLDTSGSSTTTPDPLNGGFYEYDTFIAVFVRNNPALPVSITNLNMVACTDNPNNDTNQAQLAFTAEAGKTYYITIAEYDGVLGDAGTFPGYEGGSLIFKMSTALTISGNAGISGAVLSYKGGATTSNSNGDYSLAVPSGFTNTVTPSHPLGAVFTATSRSYINVVASLTAQNYTAQRTFSDLRMWTTDFNYNTQGWRVEKHPRLMGDVNGDGRDDIIGYGYDGVWVALSTGTSFAPVTMWTTDYSYTAQGWRIELHPRMVGDVNGDGKADLVGFGYAGVWIALSDGTQFLPVSMWTTDFNYNTQGWRVEKHPRMMGDVNNDGKDDIIGYGYDGVWVALSTGTSFAPVTLWTTDYSYTAQGWRIELHPRMVGDFNGDGRADLIGFGYAGAWIALSTGTSFAPVTMWTSDFNYNTQGWRVEKHPRVIGDVNGDGKDDIIGYGYDGVWIALSTGTGFTTPVSMWTSNYSYTAQGWRVELHPRMVGDPNGDGMDDLVGFGYAGVWINK